MPITWRNVLGPSLADASRPLQAAQQSFDGAFNTLNRALAQRQEAATVAQAKQEEAAKQGYLDTVQGAKTIEALQALQNSGQLERSLQGLTPEQRASVRGADERRLGELRDFATKELQFTAQQQQATDAQKAREAQPIVDRLTTLANSNDPEARASAQAALNIYSANGMVPRSGELMGKLVGADRGAVEHGFKVNEDARSQTTLDDRLKTNAMQRAEMGLRQQLTKTQLNQAQQDQIVQQTLAQAYLDSRGNTMIEGGLPNERAMVDAAGQLVAGKDPLTAARVLQEAAKSDQTRVEAWRTAEDTNGFVGSAPLNSTSVINALTPEIAKITVGSKGEVGASITEKIRQGHRLRKGTRLDDGTILKEDLTIPIPLNVAKAALAESDTTLGLDRGGDAVTIIERYMNQPGVIRDILNRQNAEKIRATLQSNPTIPNSPLKR